MNRTVRITTEILVSSNNPNGSQITDEQVKDIVRRSVESRFSVYEDMMVVKCVKLSLSMCPKCGESI